MDFGQFVKASDEGPGPEGGQPSPPPAPQLPPPQVMDASKGIVKKHLCESYVKNKK